MTSLVIFGGTGAEYTHHCEEDQYGRFSYHKPTYCLPGLKNAEIPTFIKREYPSLFIKNKREVLDFLKASIALEQESAHVLGRMWCFLSSPFSARGIATN